MIYRAAQIPLLKVLNRHHSWYRAHHFLKISVAADAYDLARLPQQQLWLEVLQPDRAGAAMEAFLVGSRCTLARRPCVKHHRPYSDYSLHL